MSNQLKEPDSENEAIDNQLSSRVGKYASFRPAWPSFTVYLLGAFIFFTGPQYNPEALIGFWPGLILGIGFASFTIFKRFTVLYSLSSTELQKISYLPGGLTKINVEQISRIDLHRGLLHRILDVAHIHIYVDNQDAPAMRLFGVSEPGKFKETLLGMGAKDHIKRGAWRS